MGWGYEVVSIRVIMSPDEHAGPKEERDAKSVKSVQKVMYLFGKALETLLIESHPELIMSIDYPEEP